MRGAISVACIGLVVAAFAARGSAGEPAACDARVSFGVIPSWAAGGFGNPHQRMPHALARHGRIAALLFAYPLRYPPSATHSNKILWVARTPAAHPTALWIRAQRMVGMSDLGAAISRVVQGGPGPSIVNLPAAGCWRLTLYWSGRTDTLDLRYR